MDFQSLKKMLLPDERLISPAQYLECPKMYKVIDTVNIVRTIDNEIMCISVSSVGTYGKLESLERVIERQKKSLGCTLLGTNLRVKLRNSTMYSGHEIITDCMYDVVCPIGSPDTRNYTALVRGVITGILPARRMIFSNSDDSFVSSEIVPSSLTTVIVTHSEYIHLDKVFWFEHKSIERLWRVAPQ